MSISAQRLGAVALCCSTALLLGGCQNSTAPEATTGLNVVAEIYPYAWATERIVGSAGQVTQLVPANVDAHDYELKPSDLTSLTTADLVIYQSGFSAAFDEAIQQSDAASIDLASLVQLRDFDNSVFTEGNDDHETEQESNYAKDPHIWLDPDNMSAIATAIADELSEIDPDHAAEFQTNHAALYDDLTTLDNDYQSGLQNCARTSLVTSHAAFGYLADAYGLTQVAIAGISPEDDPALAYLAQVKTWAAEGGVTTVFTEPLVSSDYADTLAQELGVQTALLDPLESLTAESLGDDYLSTMRANLQAIRSANSCQ